MTSRYGGHLSRKTSPDVLISPDPTVRQSLRTSSTDHTKRLDQQTKRFRGKQSVSPELRVEGLTKEVDKSPKFFKGSVKSPERSLISDDSCNAVSINGCSSSESSPQVFSSISKALLSIKVKCGSPEPTAVVCLNDLLSSPEYKKMKRANFPTQKIVIKSPRNMTSRSQSPKTRSSVENQEMKTPKKMNSESAVKSNTPSVGEKAEKHLRERSSDRSRNRSPRSKPKESPEMKASAQSGTGKQNELSPRELDAIRTLRKLKTQSPKKKAITNEMRKSACHSKQNERKNSTSPQKNSPNNKKSEVRVPSVLITAPEIDKESAKSTPSQSPSKRPKRNAARNVNKVEVEKVEDTVNTTPKRRSRRKKSISSSEKNEGSARKQSSASDVNANSLKVESSRSTKRVRSPNAKYKEDMILYPWDSPRKKQSPKKSPSEKDGVKTEVLKENVTSDNEEPSSEEGGDSESDSDSTEEINVQEIRNSILRAARVLNFDELNLNEYNRIGEQLQVENYKSLLHTSQETSQNDLKDLSDLITKVTGSVDKPNEELVKLFGSVEVPEYCSENVTYKSDSDESDDKGTEETLNVAGKSTPENENTKSDTSSTEETDSKPKNDSDLDSTIEYNQDLAHQSEDENKQNTSNVDFSDKLKKEIVSPELVEHISQKEQSEIVDTQDEISDDQKERNLFTVFDGKTDGEAAQNESIGKDVNSKIKTEDIKGEPFGGENEKTECSKEEQEGRSAVPNNDSKLSISNIADILSKRFFQSSSINSINEVNTCSDICSSKELSDNSNIEDTGDEHIESKTDIDKANNPETNLDLENKSIGHSEDNVGEEGVSMKTEETKSEANMTEVLEDKKDDKEKDTSDLNRTDRSSYEQLKSSPRCVPRFSTTIRKTITEPSPLTVLRLVEKDANEKQSAFLSSELDDYLQTALPVIDKQSCMQTEDADSVKHAVEQSSGLVKEQLNDPDPDFDEIDSFLFMSYPTEEALAAHIELEKKLDWLDETNLKKMTHFINKEKHNEDDAVTPSKSPAGKHSMRGIPGRIAKYQKLLKQELEIILKAKENRIPAKLRTQPPDKTADITKIKGWKDKYASTEELQRATGLHFSEAGKLHWRTEERILKQLEPSDVKEIGLNIKKKRRKLVHYTNRKGDSKRERPKLEAYDGEESVPFEEHDNITQDNDETEKTATEKIPYCVKYFSQHKYGKRKMFIKQMKMDSVDEDILKKLGSEKIARNMTRKEIKANDPEAAELKQRRNKPLTYVIKLSHSMALAALSALDKKLAKNARVIAAQKAKKKELKRKSRKEDTKRDGHKAKKEKDNGVSGSESEWNELEDPGNDEVKPLKESKTKCHTEAKDSTTEEKTDVHGKEESGKSKACDRPGCRYGCICHLCKFSDEEKKEESDEKPPCDKAYCKLGCICDSIDTKTELLSHCRKPACMFKCACKPSQPETGQKSKRGGKKQSKKKKRPRSRKSSVEDKEIEDLVRVGDDADTKGNNSDWEPPVPKRKRETPKVVPVSSRYADLPKRESRYRIAKNLDAVTRKAKQVYESSEMFIEQKVKRRKSDPVLEMISDGDFMLDDLPPDWRDSYEQYEAPLKTQVKEEPYIPVEETTNEMQECSKLDPISGEILVSGDESEAEKHPEEEEKHPEDGDIHPEEGNTCARIRKYNGDRKSTRSLYTVMDPEETPEVKPVKTSTSQKKTVLIDLVDSDCEVTEVFKTKPVHKPPREMTVSEKLRILKQKEANVSERETPTDKIDPSVVVVAPPQSGGKPKWRTQMVCLKAKKKSSENQSSSESEIKLLEIMSNCLWEADRADMLSKISHIISKDYSSTNHVVLWNNYALQFLPKADKPAVIPHELKSKLPDSMYSIRVRVTQNLNDIEQAVNNPGKDSSGDNAGEESISSLSAQEKQQYASLRIQKKLIDKIRFAEKLKDLIEQEEKKGAGPSKFSISKEGIEKALKRYKTQLWRAYTGNSNMSLAQLREAVMKAKSSNYTEKINQAINAIEKKASETNVQSTPTSPVSSEAPPLSLVPKNSCDVKTLSSSAMARIQANQGIMIKGTNQAVPLTQPAMTRLISQGGKQTDVFLVPVTTSEGMQSVGLPPKLNIMPKEGLSNFVNIQPVPGTSSTFRIPSLTTEFTTNTTNAVITSTSSSAIATIAAPTASSSASTPSVVTSVCKPVMSSYGGPRPFKPVSSTAGAATIRMPVALSSGQAGGLVVSPVTSTSSSATQPMLLGGMINGQKVFLQATRSEVQPTAAKSQGQAATSVSSVSGPEVIPTVSQTGGNTAADFSATPVVSGSNSVPNVCVAGSVTLPLYPSVRFVTTKAGTLPSKFSTVTKSLIPQGSVQRPFVAQGPAQKSFVPPTMSVPGTPHSIPIRLLNPPPSAPGTIVQLIPVTTSIESTSTFQASIQTPRLIAVPIHFEKRPLSSPTGVHTQGVSVASPTMGIKTCTTTIHRPVSPATGFVPLSTVTSSETVGMSVSSSAKTSMNTDMITELDAHSNQQTVLNHDSPDSTDHNEIPIKKKKKKRRTSSDDSTEHVQDSDAQQKMPVIKKRKKSYAEKLSDLNKLDADKKKKGITIDLGKTAQDDTADISESINDSIKPDVNTAPSLHVVSNSVDGDYYIDKLQPAGSGGYDIQDVDKFIDSIASALGDTRNSEDISNQGSEMVDSLNSRNDNCSGKDNSKDVIDQDSDGCLIIDETYKSPAKHKLKVQTMEMEGLVDKKRKIEKDSEGSHTNKRCRSSSPEVSNEDVPLGVKQSKETSGSMDGYQICIEDSEEEIGIDVECLEDGATGSAQLHGKINRRKSSQSPLLEQEPALLFQRLELSSGKTRKHKEIESNRRYVMKKMYSALAKMVLKYNPDIKQKFIKFVSDSTVQLPKIMILLGAVELINKLKEEYQCLTELKTDGQQYQETLKQKLKKLSDSFIADGTPDIVVQNFLKGVASSAKYMNLESESNSIKKKSLKEGGKASLVDLTQDDVTDDVQFTGVSCSAAVPSGASGVSGASKVPAVVSIIKPINISEQKSTGVTSVVSLLKSSIQVNADNPKVVILKTLKNSEVKVAHLKTPSGDKVIEILDSGNTNSDSENVLTCDKSDVCREKTDTSTVDTIEVINDDMDGSEKSASAENSSNTNKDVISLVRPNVERNSESPKIVILRTDQNSAEVKIAHTNKDTSDNVIDMLDSDNVDNPSVSLGLSTLSESNALDVLEKTNVCEEITDNSVDDTVGVTTVDLKINEPLKSAENGSLINKDDNMNKNSLTVSDNQSSAIKIPSNHSNEALSESSSQSSNQSEKVVELNSAVIEKSAAKINHSALLILDDKDNEDGPQLHHLDDILDEWSAEICSQ